MCVHRLDACTCVLLHVYLDHLYFLVLGRQVPFLPKPKASKTATQRRSGTGKSKRKERMAVGETGSELDVEAMPAKKAKKGGGVGSFEAKFKKAGMKPVQVWEDKYASVLKSNGWGGNGGKKWPKNWREREEATAELDRILGRQVLVQLAAKTSEAGPAGESAWGVDADG